jgi:hypothetical protein
MCRDFSKAISMCVSRSKHPTHLTSKQKELLKEFAAIGGEDVNPMSKGLFREDEAVVRLILHRQDLFRTSHLVGSS